jgi:hypothetical protein
MARRLGAENYIAFASDGLTSVGAIRATMRKGWAVFQKGGPLEDDGGLCGSGDTMVHYDETAGRLQAAGPPSKWRVSESWKA